MYKLTMFKGSFKYIPTIGFAFSIIDSYCREREATYGLGNISTENGKINVTVFDNYNTPIELVIENV